MRNREPHSNALEFLKKYWLLLLGILVIFPYLRAFMQKMAVKTQVDDVKNDMSLNSQVNALDNPILQESEADNILKTYGITSAKKAEFKADLKAFVHHLGLSYKWYDPKSWTENDKEATNILIKWIRHLPKFQELYFNVFTESRNLRTDFNKLIDDDQKKRVYYYQNLYNVKYF